ncbi:hypothetical protein [uncultured Bradyrhizobium sp.]|uniref:hypothetical protein n=1 Tax=uncultured Bradyrhizobium sp. TaxID=199684 RepID=UPI00260579FA|nr:hypothetical protein [uncultured Bradyrhizobium sp.]
MQTATTRAANVHRRRFLLDGWDDTRDEMHAIERAALAYLGALDLAQAGSYNAAAVKRFADHGSDFAGRALDLLSDMHGDAQKRLDAEGIAPEEATYDDGILRAEFDLWTKRAEARR